VPDRAPIAERWSSRKFFAMFFWQGVMTALLWHDKLPSEAFVSITWVLLGGYFVVNGAQHIMENRK
jgi:hypothetical protein